MTTTGAVTRSRAKSQPNSTVAPMVFDKQLTKQDKKEKFGSELNMITPEEIQQEISLVQVPEVVNPEDVSPARWLTMFKDLNATLATLQTQVREVQGLKEKVEQFSIDWKENVDNAIETFDNQADQQNFQIKVLINMIINLEEKVQNLDNKFAAANQREKKPNLIVQGIVEKEDETKETLKEDLKNFFKDEMEIEAEIKVANMFRMGRGGDRPLLVKLKHPNDKAVIYANAGKLKDKENSREKMYFVHDDMMEDQQEIKKLYRDMVKENKDKEEDEKLQIKMRKGKVYVNNNMVKQKVAPPTKAEILRMSEKQYEETRAIKLAQGPEHMEKGSEYFSYAIKVKSEKEVAKAYTKLKIKHADATHVSCAYRLQNPIGPYWQEAVDDGDIGIGRAMLKTMKTKDITEMAVFVVRYYGGVHLGKRCFEIASFLTEKASKAWYSKRQQRKSRSARQISQTSIMTAGSIDEMESQDEDQLVNTEAETEPKLELEQTDCQ